MIASIRMFSLNHKLVSLLLQLASHDKNSFLGFPRFVFVQSLRGVARCLGELDFFCGLYSWQWKYTVAPNQPTPALLHLKMFAAARADELRVFFRSKGWTIFNPAIIYGLHVREEREQVTQRRFSDVPIITMPEVWAGHLKFNLIKEVAKVPGGQSLSGRVTVFEHFSSHIIT